MEIKKETDSYNERRYGNPWIAKVDFETSKKGEFLFGDWVGSRGGAGTLIIEATPGDIIADGQKDSRKPQNSAPSFWVVLFNGTLEHIGDKGAAYKHFEASKTPDNNLLQREKECLLARIAEIDERRVL